MFEDEPEERKWVTAKAALAMSKVAFLLLFAVMLVFAVVWVAIEFVHLLGI